MPPHPSLTRLSRRSLKNLSTTNVGRNETDDFDKSMLHFRGEDKRKFRRSPSMQIMMASRRDPTRCA